VQSQVPGSYKANPIPTVNKRADIPADFFSKCIKKGWLKTLPKKQANYSIQPTQLLGLQA
jgi:hypothetical protein